MTLNLNLTASDRALITTIAERAVKIAEEANAPRDKIDVILDLAAVHLNGNPLRLADMAAWERDFDIAHDVFGIERHLDRETGKLTDFFSPRFTDTAALRAAA